MSWVQFDKTYVGMNQTEIFEKLQENLHLILTLIATFFILFFFITIAECYNAYTLSCKKGNPNDLSVSSQE